VKSNQTLPGQASFSKESKNLDSLNIIDKIFRSHTVLHSPGHPAVLAVDLMLLHEVTSAQAFDVLRDRKLNVYDTTRLLATLDHSIPTRINRFQIFDDSARVQVETLRNNAQEFGVTLHDFDSGKQGIVHVIGPEHGATQPGMTIVCGDSHTSTHGAFGALAFGIGTTEVGHVLATSCLLQEPPKTMQICFNGVPPKGVFAKDVILHLIATIGIGGATGHIIEFCGDIIKSWSMEERMTVCNMSIECGARAGLIGPDETTIQYLRGLPAVPKNADFEKASTQWLALRSETRATYDKTVSINLNDLQPMITWGTNPGQGMLITQNVPNPQSLGNTEESSATQALRYTKLTPDAPIVGIPIQWAFLGSCTNGRISDLRVAARLLDGKKVHPAVTFYVVPGSEEVKALAEKEGLDKIFLNAGAEWRMPGCSMCLGMNDDKVPAGERCLSTSNRNFVGRQGTGSITHLASPATVTVSAIAGSVTSPLPYFNT
jgi:3-isopropylmalate/(R)-2-methylmalate dehydratase large subunit